MRGLPFFKPKKGIQFAGEGFTDSSGGGGGGSDPYITELLEGSFSSGSTVIVAQNVDITNIVDITGVVKYTYNGNPSLKTIDYYQGNSDRLYWGINNGEFFLEQHLYGASNITYSILIKRKRGN